MKKYKKSNNLPYFAGIDIGSNSVGYAAVTENYTPLKYQSHPIMGVHLFEEAQLANERRTHRTARRRLDRRQQRIQLLRELFAIPISMVDKNFFMRIDRSSLKKEPDEIPYAVFADSGYTDCDFHRQYPTIHHLIAELIDSDRPHDIRLVYLACAWLLAHRGHFFSDVNKEKIDEIINFSVVYNELESFLEDHNFIFQWKHLNIDVNTIGIILKSSIAKTDKYKQIVEFLHIEKRRDEQDEPLWIDENELCRMLCGLEGKLITLFSGTNYQDIKLSLASDDDKIAETLSLLNDEEAALLSIMKKIYDWSILADIMGESKNISCSKVKIYEKHKADLKSLKYIVRKYLSTEDYNNIFRDSGRDNYAAYCKSNDSKKTDRESFYKFLKNKLKEIKLADSETPETIADQEILEKINQDIALEKFLPKQIHSDNRTIPYQLYWNELYNLLNKASSYLPFLLNRDEDGISVRDKILSIMEFRIPYFVGPLNSNSPFAWIKRKATGRILPWNFDKKVDLDASEQEFINRMVNRCTYLPKEKVLPKRSLLYQRFEVLNLINMIHIDGAPVSVECKQKIYTLFQYKNKVNKKNIADFLKSNNLYCDIDENSITGIDDTITASLSSWKIFQPLFDDKKLTASDAEEIICKRSCTEDKSRFQNYLKKFALLDTHDIKRISAADFSGFGRLSAKLLTDALHFDSETGNKMSIINMMWEYNLNLQQLMSDQYPFAKMVKKSRQEYYSSHPQTLTKRLDDMYVSNSVKRPIIRALTILDEITETVGYPPEKIFIEMARDTDNSQKGQRTVSRLAQLKKIYQDIADNDIRQLANELERFDDSALQKDTLYLYFMQLGRDMYSGVPIDINHLECYDKEHIYPRSKVKDDSILNNIVLVKKEDNGAKSDKYPIDSSIRQKMTLFWKSLKDKKLISEEKFFRLTRSTPFSDNEKWGFINRQLVETRQSTKVVTELLKELYPDSEIVYVKAGLVSDFRHKFNLIKSRTVNDLHHGKDAYLNIVVGNVWHESFTREWFFNDIPKEYNIKTEVIFNRIQKNLSGRIIWNGHKDIELVKNVTKRNYLHLTNYTYCQHGGFFNQNPVSAKSGLVPLKKGRSTEIYGGYNKPTAAFFILALTEEKSKKKSKKELTLIAVDLLIAKQLLNDQSFALQYVKNFIDPDGKFSIQFPLGLKPIKIKTMVEVDNGLRFTLNGKSSGGSQLLIGISSSLLLDNYWESYIKALESFLDKKRKNPNITYSEKHDKLSVKQNSELYDILLAKLKSSLFAKRPANPLATLEQGQQLFYNLNPEQQAKILLDLVSSFGRSSWNGVDLTLIGGSSKAGTTKISSKLSNWKKNFDFKEAYIVYSDASGLHETKSINLLDLI